jgi:hypothetical protein
MVAVNLATFVAGIIRCVGVAAVVAAFHAAIPAAGWEVEIDGSQSEDDEARVLALDERGYILAGGDIEELGNRWLVVKLAPGDGSELWRAMPSGPLPFPFNERLLDLAVDADGDAIAAGHMQEGGGGIEEDFAVVKIRGTDGQELWRFVFDDPSAGSREYANAVAVDANGDVIAAGVVETGDITGYDSVWLVTKLRGSDGVLLWTRQVDGSGSGYDRPHDVAVTANGDVIAVGGTTNGASGPDVTVVKLAASDGSVLWRADPSGSTTNASEYVERVVLDASGNVYAAGRMSTSGWSRVTGINLANADGALVWRAELCCGVSDTGAALSVALTGDNGVIAGGHSKRQDLDSPFTVARFDATTGSIDWRVVLAGTTGYGRANAVAVDERGDVWAAGQMEVTSQGKTDAYLAKIHPCVEIDEPCNELEFSFNAEVVFEKRSDGSSTDDDDFDEHYALAMGDEHAPVVAGVRYGNHPEVGAEEPHVDFVVERFSESGRKYGGPNPFVPACADGADNDGDGLIDTAADSGCDDADDLFEQAGTPVVHMVGGRRLIAKDRYGNTKARKLSLQSQDGALPLPTPGGASDPSLHGAVLELVNPATGERSFAALPAQGWSGRGNPAGADGYVFRGSSAWGPCRAVQLRPGVLKASCRGQSIAFSLDEPNQGELSGRLHLAGGDRICTQFGGSVVSDVSRSDGGTGVFYAENAPPPSACAEP